MTNDVDGSAASDCYAAQFDDFESGYGRVVIRDRGCETVVVIEAGGTEHVLLRADRDQWGVWLEFAGVSVAQEDQTRSFIDAVIKVLTEVRRRNEYGTTDATVSA
jgi:hypothetical protein